MLANRPRLIGIRLLYLIRDPYPTFRPDVLVLFGKRLPELGIQSDIVATRSRDMKARASTWPGGAEYVIDYVGNPIRRLLRGLRVDLCMLIRGSRYDAVIVRDKILAASLALVLLDHRMVYYWMSFPFPEEDLVRSRLPLRGWLFRSLIWLRGRISCVLLYRFVIPRVRHVFVQSDRMAEAVVVKSRRCSGITPVPMGVDEMMACQGAFPVRQYTPEDAFVLVYLGSLDRLRRIDFLLEVLDWLRHAEPSRAFRLHLIGGASTHEECAWLEQKVNSMGLDGMVETMGPMPMPEAWRLARLGHVGLSAIPRGELYDVSSPTKTVEYLALGLPVVVNDIPDQVFLVEQTGAGLCVPMNAERFGSAILHLQSRYADFSSRALAAREWVLSERGYRRLADRVADALYSCGIRRATK